MEYKGNNRSKRFGDKNRFDKAQYKKDFGKTGQKPTCMHCQLLNKELKADFNVHHDPAKCYRKKSAVRLLNAMSEEENEDEEEQEEEGARVKKRTKGMPILVARDNKTGWYMSEVVPKKGKCAHAVSCMERVLDQLGYKKYLLKTDQEPSILEFKETIKRLRSD